MLINYNYGFTARFVKKLALYSQYIMAEERG